MLVAATAAGFLTVPTARAHVAACNGRPSYTLCAIHHWRNGVWRAEDELAAAHTRYGWTAERSAASATYRLWVRHLWHTRYGRWMRRLSPWPTAWLADALCVHEREGAWNDPGAPYWGGLQMDAGFMATYGERFLRTWGTADHWPPVAQLVAAYHAWQVRRWTPWPNTAAACGLL